MLLVAVKLCGAQVKQECLLLVVVLYYMHSDRVDTVYLLSARNFYFALEMIG